jgi:hypothetical protein
MTPSGSWHMLCRDRVTELLVLQTKCVRYMHGSWQGTAADHHLDSEKAVPEVWQIPECDACAVKEVHQLDVDSLWSTKLPRFRSRQPSSEPCLILQALS